MFDEVANKKSRWRIFWPDVDDSYGAQEAIRLSYWAAFLVSGTTAIAAITGILGAGLSSLPDAVIFALIGFGLRWRWRSAALVGLVLFTIGLIFSFSVTQSGWIGVLTIFIFVGFLNGVRGTFAYRRLSRRQPLDGEASRPLGVPK